jgi:O-antigen ligase
VRKHSYFFSERSRIVVIHLLLLTFTLIFSYCVNAIVLNRYPFFYKDLFTPIVFVRNIIIASIISNLFFNNTDLKQFITIIFIISILIALLAFGQKYKLFGYGSIMQQLYPVSQAQLHTLNREIVFSRVTGTFGNPNVFGGVVVMLSAFCLNCGLYLRGIMRSIGLAIYFLLATVVLVTTGSRTALLGLACVSLMSIFFSFRKGHRFPVIVVFVFLSLAIFLLPFLLSVMPVNPRVQRFVSGEEGVFEIGSFMTRLKMWQSSWLIVKNSIIIGMGATKTTYQISDNGYVFTLLRVGVVGLSIYVSFLYFLLKKGLSAALQSKMRLQKTVLFGLTMIVCNHVIFEISGEFFWNIRYGALFCAMAGLLSAISIDSRLDCKSVKYSANRTVTI